MTALMIGDTFSSCLVSTPIDTPPILIPSFSLRGIGTRSDTMPRINVTSPIQNSAFMSVRRVLLTRVFNARYDPQTCQHDGPDRDPVRGHVHQRGGVN